MRVEIDAGLAGATFGLWDDGTWDESTWGSDDPAWTDITAYVHSITIDRGIERWGQRYETGTFSIVVDNTTGIFSPESGVASPWHLPFQPGRRVRVVAIPDPDTGTKVPIVTGSIDASFDAFADGGFDLTTTIPCVDYMALWGNHNPAALDTPTGVEATSERVATALDRMDWPDDADHRDIQTGDHTMQSSHLAQTVLEECGRAADAEGGAFFCSHDGKATFKARDWLITDARSTTIQGYIGYDEIPTDAQGAYLEDLQTSWERARVVNRVQFARIGSTMQQVDDAASQSIHDVRSYQRTDLQNNSDGEVLALAERYLQMFKQSRMRIDAVTIAAVADPGNEDLNRLIWDTRFGDLISVKGQTAHGWDIERELQVMGIHHEITGDEWRVTLSLDDAMTTVLGGRDVLMAQLAPVAWWKFNETSGTTSADSAGNHDLTWPNGVTQNIVGPLGSSDGAVELAPGSSQYATVANEGDLELLADMSIEAWVQIDSTAGQEVIISCAALGGDDYLYHIEYDGGVGQVRFRPNADPDHPLQFAVDLEDGEWHHIVVTVEWTGSGRIIKVYLDSVLKITGTPTYEPGALTRVINVGRNAELGLIYYGGDISELTIFDYALTADDVFNLFQSSYQE